jgi:hypothetical protein
MEVKKTKDHFTIEMEAYEYDYLIKAVDFGATWMDENGYREEQRRYENLRDDLKMYQSGEIRGRTLKERLDRCRILKSYESRVVVMTQHYLYEMENAVLKHQRDPEHIQDDVAKLTAEYNNKVSELYAERDEEIDAFDKETLMIAKEA